jgi:hypothetical protein
VAKKTLSTARTPTPAASRAASVRSVAVASTAAKKSATSTTSTAAAVAAAKQTSPAAGAIGAVGSATRPEVVAKPDLTPGAPLQFTRRVLRPRDLVALEFTFVNLKIVSAASGEGLRLQRAQTGQPAYIVLGFPPQHLLEEAFWETAPEAPLPGLSDENPQHPVQSRLAGPSRLVFRVPTHVSELPYQLADVLGACRQYELNVAPSATPPEAESIFRPGLSIPLAAEKVSTASFATTAMPRAATARTAAARAEAASAFTSVAVAEAQNQWYAKRSPSIRDLATQADLAQVTAVWEALQILPKLAPPGATHTAIEAPTRLILSPNKFGAWVHAVDPVESARSGRVELWHTRLGVRVGGGVTEQDHFLNTVRAIWSPDVRADDPYGVQSFSSGPFRAPLDPLDRHNIVHLSANHQLYEPDTRPRKRHQPRALAVDQLMLSSLGAWLNVRGNWEPPGNLSVEEWRNRSTMGRDHYVRVVYAGRLYPFGHRASLIKVTERKFHSKKKGNAAFLRQRMFIVVREPYRLIGQSGRAIAGESLDRKMPLKSARITTLVTPNLDKPENAKCAVIDFPGNHSHGRKLFWPHVTGKPFLFHLQFEDGTGAQIDCAMPLVFLGKEYTEGGPEWVQRSIAEKVAKEYTERPAFRTNRRPALRGQRVQFAPSQKHGDTSYEVAEMEFALNYAANGANRGELIPTMKAATVTVPAIKHLALDPSSLPEVQYPPVYAKGGFAPTGANRNPGQVFLELVSPNSARLNLSPRGDRTGALIAPNLSLTGLSRLIGPIGGSVETFAKEGLKPADFFGNLGDALPKLFGCIGIVDIIDNIGLGKLDQLPRFLSEHLTAATGLLDDLSRAQALLGQLHGKLPGLASQANALGSAALTLVARLQAVLADPLNVSNHNEFKSGFSGFTQAATTLRNGLGGRAVPEEAQFARTQLDQLLGRFSGSVEQAAKMAADILNALEALSEQRIRFEWRPPIKNWPKTKPIFEVLAGGGLVIAVELSAKSGSQQEPSLNVACRLQKFNLNLIAPIASFLRLKFNKIEFTGTSSKKPDVNVDFGGIEFIGVLSFVETLRTLIPLDGFSDPPALSVSEQGVEASFSLGLPNIAIGVFSLSNLSLGAALTVPFVGQQPLSVRFNFCERSDPFRLTVWIFGGGGFFAVTVTPAGVQVLEAAFEFGAAVSLDFGVASGSVSVMAGVYYRMEADEASLTGYFNLKGRVSVLGLITASIELALELYYEFASGKCVGRASIIVEVEVLLFSASVEIKCEKKFAGSNGDPSFLQIMAPYDDPVTEARVDPWAEYCAAFAA